MQTELGRVLALLNFSGFRSQTQRRQLKRGRFARPSLYISEIDVADIPSVKRTRIQLSFLPSDDFQQYSRSSFGSSSVCGQTNDPALCSGEQAVVISTSVAWSQPMLGKMDDMLTSSTSPSLVNEQPEDDVISSHEQVTAMSTSSVWSSCMFGEMDYDAPFCREQTDAMSTTSGLPVLLFGQTNTGARFSGEQTAAMSCSEQAVSMPTSFAMHASPFGSSWPTEVSHPLVIGSSSSYCIEESFGQSWSNSFGLTSMVEHADIDVIYTSSLPPTTFGSACTRRWMFERDTEVSNSAASPTAACSYSPTVAVSLPLAVGSTSLELGGDFYGEHWRSFFVSPQVF